MVQREKTHIYAKHHSEVGQFSAQKVNIYLDGNLAFRTHPKG